MRGLRVCAVLALVVGGAALGLGCEAENEPEPGDAIRQIGEDLEDASDDVADVVDSAAEEIKDAAEHVQEDLEDATP